MRGPSRSHGGTVPLHLGPNSPNGLLRLHPCQRSITIHRMLLLLQLSCGHLFLLRPIYHAGSNERPSSGGSHHQSYPSYRHRLISER